MDNWLESSTSHPTMDKTKARKAQVYDKALLKVPGLFLIHKEENNTAKQNK